MGLRQLKFNGPIISYFLDAVNLLTHVCGWILEMFRGGLYFCFSLVFMFLFARSLFFYLYLFILSFWGAGGCLWVYSYRKEKIMLSFCFFYIILLHHFLHIIWIWPVRGGTYNLHITGVEKREHIAKCVDSSRDHCYLFTFFRPWIWHIERWTIVINKSLWTILTISKPLYEPM